MTASNGKQIARYVPELSSLNDIKNIFRHSTDMGGFLAFVDRIEPGTDEPFYKRYLVDLEQSRDVDELTQSFGWNYHKTDKRLGELEIEITYSFSDEIRRNLFRNDTKYGADGMTFNRLYELLCDRFNGGERFITTYFNENFAGSDGYLKLVDLVQGTTHEFVLGMRKVREIALKKTLGDKATKRQIANIRAKDEKGWFVSAGKMTIDDAEREMERADELITKAMLATEDEGEREELRSLYKFISEYEFGAEIDEDTLEEVKETIAYDIQAAMQEGTIRLNTPADHAYITMKQRERAGLPIQFIGGDGDRDVWFYASGQLADNIIIMVSLGPGFQEGSGMWQ